jgi:uncharacterized protein YggE
MTTRPDHAPQPTITVTGTGRTWIAPDVADLRLGVSLTATTVAEARGANASAMQAILASLRAAGIKDRDIRTENLNLNPVYDYSRNEQPPRLVGYNHANTVAVTIRDLAGIAQAIDGALDAGATSLDGLTFRVDDPTEAERAARVAAVADARAKAGTLAGAAGVRITGVQEIGEASGHLPIPMPYRKMELAGAQDASTPIEAGQNEIAVSVSVSFTVEPA